MIYIAKYTSLWLLNLSIAGNAVSAFTVPSPTTTATTSTSFMKLSMMETDSNDDNDSGAFTRKTFLDSMVGSATAAAAGYFGSTQPVFAEEATASGGRPESLDIDNFLRTGTEAFPMGVSSQAGKSKPVTGVFLRDGTELSRDTRTGNVLTEIVLGDKADLSAILVSFSSPWPLAKGSVFDVECRDSKTGDGAFLAVTERTNGKEVSELPSSFFLDQVFAPTGRFSFYGSPTNIKVKKSENIGKNRVIEFTFSNLSQSTNAEIPRSGILIASIPDKAVDQAVMLVGSASANRWKKGSEQAVRNTIESFNASPSPKSSLKIRKRQSASALLE